MKQNFVVLTNINDNPQPHRQANC